MIKLGGNGRSVSPILVDRRNAANASLLNAPVCSRSHVQGSKQVVRGTPDNLDAISRLGGRLADGSESLGVVWLGNDVQCGRAVGRARDLHDTPVRPVFEHCGYS